MQGDEALPTTFLPSFSSLKIQKLDVPPRPNPAVPVEAAARDFGVRRALQAALSSRGVGCSVVAATMAWDANFDVRGLSLQPSMSQVLRSIKRQEQGHFNCVASIIDDSSFVQQMAEHWEGLPLFPNLRCGLWYVRSPSATCYFKSTDGHSGNWSFSTTRLNLHVAEAAAVYGGALLVDATRRGKKLPVRGGLGSRNRRQPKGGWAQRHRWLIARPLNQVDPGPELPAQDALAKTVPFWAAVMNRAVQRLRQRQGTDGGFVSWDTDVHLPPWVSGNERHQIRLRLDAWADSLEEVGRREGGWVSGVLLLLHGPHARQAVRHALPAVPASRWGRTSPSWRPRCASRCAAFGSPRRRGSGARAARTLPPWTSRRSCSSRPPSPTAAAGPRSPCRQS